MWGSGRRNDSALFLQFIRPDYTQLKVNQSESKAAGFDRRSCYFLNVIAELHNESRDLHET